MNIFLDDEQELVKSIDTNEITDDVKEFNEELVNKSIKNSVASIRLSDSNKMTKSEKYKLIQNLIKKVFEKVDNKSLEDNQSLQLEQSPETYVVDRFEGMYAVCENRDTKEMLNIEKLKLPSNLHEGDVLTYKDNTFTLDESKKEEIEDRIKAKARNIFED